MWYYSQKIVSAAVILLALAALLSAAGPSEYLEVDEPSFESESHRVHGRWKREEDSGWKLPGAGLLRKAKKLLSGYQNLPPNLKEAIEHGDFSNVTEQDIRDVNVTVLEYIPPSAYEKANVSLLSAFIDKFLSNNRPSALGRLVETVGDKLDTKYLLDKLRTSGTETNEAGSVLLYNAVSKVGDKGITQDLARRLVQENLIDQIPEEQLMKVKDARAAETLLNAVSRNKDKDVDDKSLIVKLVQTVYGPASEWTREKLQSIGPKIGGMPAAVLRNLQPKVVKDNIKDLADNTHTPLQAMAVADVYLDKDATGIEIKPDGTANTQHLSKISFDLGKLAAFLPTSLTKDPYILNNIMQSCDKLNLPAPIQAVTRFFEEKLSGNRKISDLTRFDFQDMNAALLKNSPPKVLQTALAEGGITQAKLEELADSSTDDNPKQNSFFQGVISQLGPYAMKMFRDRLGNIDFSGLPATLMGALGIKGIDQVKGNKIDVVTDKLKDDSDVLDDIQKAMLMKKIRDGGIDVDVPPELVNVRSRKKGDHINEDYLNGLPSDAELRLAFGSGRIITPEDLEKYPSLVGTLTPEQVEKIHLEDTPRVLAIVRESRDGPQSQTLKALHKKFVEYIRLKSDDYEADDKKLLKYVTAAEVSKLPASVLAYFIDHKQTKKLPPATRKEIMIALGELSTKDHALVPRKTREEIILQGLDALDQLLDKDAKYDVPELAAISHAVVDLPADRIERLTPVAVEQALEIIQGTNDDDDDGLKQRACLSTDQRKAWRDQIIKLYGSPETWQPSRVAALCCSLPLLDDNELAKINKEGISVCKCASDLPQPSHLADLKKALDNNCNYDLGKHYQAQKLSFDRIKAEKALDIEDLESQILAAGRRRRESDGHTHGHAHAHGHHGLNCYALRLAGSAASYDSKTLESLPAKEMTNCLYELGVDKLSHENARILWKKLVEAYDDSVDKIPPENLRLANHVLSGITEGEVAKLNFSDPDVIGSFGRPLGLSKNVLKKMATHLEEGIKYPLNLFKTTDLMVARNILCGFEKDKLATIKPISFREALPILRTIDPTCEQTRLAALANLATDPQVFGEISKWDAADVRGVGNLLKGFTTEAKSIPPEAFLGVTPTVAASLTDTLKELTPEQLSFIPTFAAQSLSEDQLTLLTDEGKESIERIQRGPLVTGGSTSLAFKLTTVFLYLVVQILL